jgi:hypothetical protein
MLRALAENYLLSFTHDRYEPAPDERADYEVVIQVATEVRKQPPAVMPQLQHVLEYNRLVRELDAEVTPAYVQMISAHADYVLAAAASPTATEASDRERGRRRDAARQVVEAWTRFDDALARSPVLAGDPTSLAAFTLDDSTLSQALFFYRDGQKHSRTPPLPPLFFGPIGETDDPAARAAIAPLRIAWSERYAGLLGQRTLDVLAYQEANRFRDLERRAHDYVESYVAFRQAAAARPVKPADLARRDRTLALEANRAAVAAAAMGLWTPAPDHTPVASLVLVEAGKAGVKDLARATAAVAEQNQLRRLHFL